MLEAERELYKLGVPVKTRHNEVAPGQYEIAPVFENANVATDHQQMIMLTLQRVAPEVRHGLPAAREAVRRHQRLGQARQLVDGQRIAGQPARPGRQPAREHPVPGVLRGRDSRRAQVCRTCCAPSSPSAATIIAWAPTKPRRRSSRSSSATADRHLRADRKGRRQVDQARRHARRSASTRCRRCPSDAGDRNRTSPFAFTGNKFEFRAVGSSQSIAGPLVVLNTIVAESLDYIATELGEGHRRRPEQAQRRRAEAACKTIIKEHKARHLQRRQLLGRVARRRPSKRGLPNLKNTVDALPALISPKNVAAVRQVRRAQRARSCTAATTSTWSGTARTSTPRARLALEHRQDDDPAGRLPLSGRAGRDGRLAQGRSASSVAHGHARHGHRAGRPTWRRSIAELEAAIEPPRRRRPAGRSQALPARRHSRP